MPKVFPISGFVEWLPEQRMAELKLLDQLRSGFERFGFLPVETRAVEPLPVLLSKGDDKEIYLLKRNHEGPDGEDDERTLGLHFDLTVPFARYVQEFQHALHFPFKRYQIQKVWRGERKQEGRYREFYQCDIDVVGSGSLPLFYDAEFAALLIDLLAALPIPKVKLKINNRKVLQGFYLGLGIAAIDETLRIVDKLAKIGAEQVLIELNELGLTQSQACQCLALASIKGGEDALARIRDLGVTHPLLEEGLTELKYVLDFNQDHMGAGLQVDASIARGLDYYTGTVYEGYMQGHEGVGAVCSGGRYDNLLQGGRQAMPGVGVSIGITRILGYLFGRNLLKLTQATPVKLMVILNNEQSRKQAFRIAQKFRDRGIATEVYHQPHGFGKQIKVAQKRGIPYVCFIEDECSEHPAAVQIKALDSGEQVQADPQKWVPDSQYDQTHWQTHW